MHDRRELVLRLVQALGLAWIGARPDVLRLPATDDWARRSVDRFAAGLDV